MQERRHGSLRQERVCSIMFPNEWRAKLGNHREVKLTEFSAN